MRDGDVMVAGAGVTGLLTALGLARRGARVVLVEPLADGAGQSGQSHGYLHRGYAYGPDEPRLPALLGSAREHWRELLTRIPPVTAGSTIAFSDPDAVLRAERYWRASGLAVRPRSTPGWLSGTPVACFGSAEPTYNVGDILRGLGVQAAAAGIERRPGAVERVERSGDGVSARITEPDGGTAVVRARSAVLAAGAGTPGLLARSGLPDTVQLRRAYMLVLRGRLPAVSVLFPEREEHGLFLASRADDDGRATWLVSDFQSFDSGGRDPGQLAGWWARRVLLTLSRVVDAAILARVEAVSGYPAVKSGLLPSSGTVAHEFGAELLDGRAVVASPSKLTLAPLAARQAVRTVAARLGLRSDDGGWAPITPVPPDRSPAREVWETPMASLDRPDLSGGLPDIGTLSKLYQR
ncbi:FAD-binding oxidoreductase [Nocardiopsis dassonvillei]|uniref:NAD(P)/FAD-dependent oxidoreductase n=1 Tax=Nocardiopsis dassonvillei TaxID=2014 RepID=UPI00102C0933|nr:FAD-dependent oxidoreductase [Nocardiopsis dassonvillei]MCP3012412.1 FAD-binding oxidoreductase [Nocardiopsis dassonvillei]